eukprot:COSAG02_NODE_27486_length_608_cov_1.210216_1_plen_111_part_10
MLPPSARALHPFFCAFQHAQPARVARRAIGRLSGLFRSFVLRKLYKTICINFQTREGRFSAGAWFSGKGSARESKIIPDSLTCWRFGVRSQHVAGPMSLYNPRANGVHREW